MRNLIKIISIFLVIIFCLLVPKIYAVDEPTFYIDNSIKYENSDEVSVNIFLKNSTASMVTFSCSLKYDTEKLEFLNSKAGSDLKATMKLAENFIDEARVGIGAVSLSGFQKDGLYYTILFKVKDEVKEDIPLELEIKECTDRNGNDIKCNTENGKIVFSKDKIDIEISNIVKIPAFEINVTDELETLEEIISTNTGAEFSINDILNYESLNTNILLVSNEGLMVPKNNGTARVKVNKGESQIAEFEIEVENERVSKVKSLEEFSDDKGNIVSDIELGLDETTYKNYSRPSAQIVQKKSHKKIFFIVFIIGAFIIICFILYKRGGKNEKFKKENRSN